MQSAAPQGRFKHTVSRIYAGIDRKYLAVALAMTGVVFLALVALSWRNQAIRYTYGLEHGFTSHGTYQAAASSGDVLFSKGTKTLVVDAVSDGKNVSWRLYQGDSPVAEGTLFSTTNPNYYRLVDESNVDVGTFSLVDGSGVRNGRGYLDHDGNVVEYVKKDTVALTATSEAAV